MLPKYGYPRLKFPKGEQKKFIENVLQKSKLNIAGISKIVNLSPRTVRDWRNEKFNIDEVSVNTFCKKFNISPPQNKSRLINEWRKIKLEGSVRGGFAHFKMYGSPATPEGCRKGGSNALKTLRKKGIIAPCKNFTLPSHKSNDLAEFVGIMLGDGGLTESQATITLNTEADEDYIQFVNKLGFKLFRENPTVSNRNDCKATNLVFSGKELIKYLIKIGLKVGNKVKNQVGVPDWIEHSLPFKIACLKGLMDTDGCMAKCTHKYKSKSYIYYNPCFANRSKPLLEFVTNTLRDIGLHPSVAGERIWLYNKAEVQTYFKLIGSSNTRLLKFKEDIPNGSGNGLLNHIA